MTELIDSNLLPDGRVGIALEGSKAISPIGSNNCITLLCDAINV